MTLLPQRLSLFSLVIIFLSTHALLATSFDLSLGDLPLTVSIPQNQNYSIDFSSCYEIGSSSLLINGKPSSSLFQLNITESNDKSLFNQIQRPWLVLNTSKVGKFKAFIQTLNGEQPICSFEFTIDVFDPKAENENKAQSLEVNTEKENSRAQSDNKRISSKDKNKGSLVFMVPEGYSPIGFALFIVAIAYIVIISICIVRRIVKNRRMQRIADEQAAILLPEGEGEEVPGALQGDSVDNQVNNQNYQIGEEAGRDSNDNRYVAINDDDSTRMEASRSS